MSLLKETIHTRTTTATHVLGVALGKALQQHPVDDCFVIALHGNLGAGKTLLAQGIAVGLGVDARVTSPTFVFVNEYPTATDKRFIHMDSYRLSELSGSAAEDGVLLEAFTFGLDEILAREDAIVVIEWAGRLGDFLPADHLAITLDYSAATPTERSISLTAKGTVSNALLSAAIALYAQRGGYTRTETVVS